MIILTEFQIIENVFDELIIAGSGFTDGSRYSDILRFEKLNILSINMIELNFYQDQNKWKHNLIPIENSKDESDRVVDLLIYKNHYALIKKLNVILGDHHKNFISRRHLNSYTSESKLMIHKQKRENNDITTIGISP